jgi:hypothetical protein
MAAGCARAKVTLPASTAKDMMMTNRMASPN